MEVRVGTSILVKKEDKVLIGKRKGSHAPGTWQFPGGHLEFNEDFEDCIKRKIKEETDLNVKNIKQVTFMNDKFEKENKHYVTLIFTADYDSGELKLMEPEKCEKWEWVSWDDLPEPLFMPIEKLKKQNYNPFENGNNS